MSKGYDDYQDSSASIDVAIIDTESGTTVSGTTSLTRAVYESPKEERDSTASQLIVQRDARLKEAAPLLPDAVHKVLENPDTFELIKTHGVVIVMNSNIYGSALCGDVYQPNFAFVRQWNQIKNNIDTKRLKNEIEGAIGLMQKRATTSDHYADLASLSFARDELEKADGPAMLKHLKKVGKFGVDIVKDVGATVLAALILGAL
jgi:hypothetical protein